MSAKTWNGSSRKHADIIFQVDDLEKRERRARLKLAEVHRNFMIYNEDDMRQAYEEVEEIRVELAVSREQEKNLRRQRDDLELRLRTLQDTLRRAEGLVGQVGAALGFLGNHMDGVLTQIESMQQRQEFAAKIIKAQEEERRRVARESTTARPRRWPTCFPGRGLRAACRHRHSPGQSRTEGFAGTDQGSSERNPQDHFRAAADDP